MRAAIYARMSTDKQSADSPADQIARCREFAEREGWQVVDDLTREDAGISGASRHDRPGLLSIMEHILEWDVLLCFDSSRLARDEEDFGWILNQLEEYGRIGYEASTGQNLASFGTRIMGVVNAEERRKIKLHTHRGLQGRVERGFAAGAVPYGYLTEREEGQGEGSRIVVVPDQAEVVRRIFELYAAGDGIKTIAKHLNAEGVAPPRPRAQKHRASSWSPNAIREMLRNPLYRGELVWNRSRWVKRRKGPRRRIERPECEWKRHSDESWRVVDDELWAAVQARIAERRGTMRYAGRNATGQVPRCEHNPRARHLLAGFLECEECGGAFCALSRGSVFGCSWRRDRGASTCSNGLRVPASDLEARVLGAIREQILVPDVATYVIDRAAAIVRERQEQGQAAAHRERLARVTREIEQLVDLATRVEGLDELATKLESLKHERERLMARIRAAEIDIDANALRPVVEQHLQDLGAALSTSEHGRRALRALFRDERLRVGPDADRGFRIEGTAWLSVALDAKGARATQDSGRLTRLVAGEGFEPPPRRVRSQSLRRALEVA